MLGGRPACAGHACGPHLLPEDGLGLPAESLLLPVVAPPALGALGLLRLLVLRHAELLVLVALLAGTEGPPVLRDVHLWRRRIKMDMIDLTR